MCMDEESVLVNGIHVTHRLVRIRGDGACLFNSISYLLYGVESMSAQIRADIVRHVTNNWPRFQPFTEDPSGVPYTNQQYYIAEMSKPYTYGNTCELMAAGEMFPFKLEVYQNGILQAQFGEAIHGIKRLKFSGHYKFGHYDVLLPLAETNNHDNCQQTSIVNEPTERKPTCSSFVCQTTLFPHTIDILKAPVAGRRGKQRRKRFTDRIRSKQVREAVKQYKANNPGIIKTANAKSNARKAEKEHLPWTDKSMSGFEYDPQINYSNDKVVDLGSRSPCSWCFALKWCDEVPGMCCKSGKVQLPALEQYPEPLHTLLTHQHPMSEHFLSASRKYNGCFQMTSFGGKDVTEGNFMPTFKVQGQVYHRIGSLFPGTKTQPSFLQIYFVGDDDSERNIRCGIYKGVNSELVSQLQKLLHDHNTYVQDFKAAVDSVPKDQKDFQVVIRADRKPSGEHTGRYNVPTNKEVAVLIVGQDFEKRDIVLHSKDNRLVRISETHRAYDALQYPLIFCRGEDGYQLNIPQKDANTKNPLTKTVSAADFYSYRIMERVEEQCYILLFRNLYSQFLVDMYAKIEAERLNWIRFNQKMLRCEDYVHLKDAMTSTDGQYSEIGKMVVLPSSFTGGPRYMHERTQDAMTYVRHFGRPDLFITFTCNPKWPEIEQVLRQGQLPHNRHDIIARVFHIKVKKMMKLLTKGNIFGVTKCHMYTVEWQKRGLPHVHILLWLEEKIRPESIDNVIRAEIPDPDFDPTLYDIVRNTMIHGPCGLLNKKSPCMTDGACVKKYPRPLLKDTQTGEDGYPLYRRRSPADGGFTVNICGVDLDNRWVVPYNPVLSRTFLAHINVEFCNSVKSIKYICKYVNKGSDQAAFTVEDLDEVTRYESGRYISSSEAAWRILCFPIHARFPPVMHLSVHLENGQRVYFYF